MKTRPWPLVVLAVIQFLTPITNILFNAWALKVSPILILSWILERSWKGIFETLCLMPIAGIAVYQMKRWSYVVFLLAMCWSISSNFRYRSTTTSSFPAWALALAYGFEALLVLYFLIPSVRSTYLDPTIRWWESKPRYDLKAPGSVISANGKLDSTILNVSEGGAFVHILGELKQAESVTLLFSILSLEFTVPGKIVHVSAVGPDGKRNYGIQFNHTIDTARRFRDLALGLKQIGFAERTDKKPWYDEMLGWALGVLRTGKGLVPEIRSRRGK